MQFTFLGDYEAVVTSGPGGKEGFLEELKKTVADSLDIDVSRIVDVDASAGSIVCSITILERTDTDPPNVPTLQSAVEYLERLVQAGLLTVR